MKNIARPASLWSWFKTHGARLHEGMKTDPQPTVVELGGAFERDYPELVWEAAKTPER